MCAGVENADAASDASFTFGKLLVCVMDPNPYLGTGTRQVRTWFLMHSVMIPLRCIRAGAAGVVIVLNRRLSCLSCSFGDTLAFTSRSFGGWGGAGDFFTRSYWPLLQGLQVASREAP